MSRKPVVMVLGSSGNVGMATLQTLTSQYSDKVDVIAGVRNPDKADKLKEIKGLKVVQATMGDEKLSGTLKGVDALFLFMPPTENRLAITKATAVAANAAGVKHVLFLGGMIDETSAESTILGRMALETESNLRALDFKLSIIGPPLFMENYFMHLVTIKKESTIYFPQDPTKPFATVAVGDVGRVAAAILADFEKHSGKSYRIISNEHTMNEFCEEMSAQLGRTIKYSRQSYEDAKQNFIKLGMKEFAADGLLETYRLIDQGAHPHYDESDLKQYKQITGMEPMTLRDWVASVKEAFQ